MLVQQSLFDMSESSDRDVPRQEVSSATLTNSKAAPLNERGAWTFRDWLGLFCRMVSFLTNFSAILSGLASILAPFAKTWLVGVVLCVVGGMSATIAILGLFTSSPVLMQDLNRLESQFQAWWARSQAVTYLSKSPINDGLNRERGNPE